MIQIIVSALLAVVPFLAWFMFNPEDGGSMFLRNIYELIPDYPTSRPTGSV
jgi:hypothetical protein